jgi:hypothetical protein
MFKPLMGGVIGHIIKGCLIKMKKCEVQQCGKMVGNDTPKVGTMAGEEFMGSGSGRLHEE